MGDNRGILAIGLERRVKSHRAEHFIYGSGLWTPQIAV